MQEKTINKPQTLLERARTISWDKAGTATAIVCLVHCLALPVGLVLFPFLGAYTELFERVEIPILITAVLLGVLSIYRGFFWHHHSKLILVLFIGGLAALFVGLLFEKPYQIAIHSMASVTLIVAHVYNAILCRRCHTCNDAQKT